MDNISDIAIIYGTDATKMTYTLLQETVANNRPKAGMNVVIKPNLAVAKPASEGATTHPEVVEGIILFLKDCGINNPIIAEGSWLGETTDWAFDRCGYTALAKKYGLKLFDTKNDKVIKKTVHDLTLGVCESIANADFLINVPVLRARIKSKSVRAFAAKNVAVSVSGIALPVANDTFPVVHQRQRILSKNWRMGEPTLLRESTSPKNAMCRLHRQWFQCHCKIVVKSR